MRTVFLILICILGSGSLQAFPSNNLATPRATAISEQSFQLAAIYWLPDYLKNNAARTEADSGGGDVKHECSIYGYVSSCPFPKVATGVIRPKVDLVCYKSCVCPAEYNKTDSSCGVGYKAGGVSCDGKFNACVARPCSDGGYFASTQVGKICSAINYGGRACYSCVPDPCYGLADKNPCTYGCQAAYAACSEKCQTCYSDNCRNRTAVAIPYGCQSYFSDCPSKCQVAYPDNCRNRVAVSCSYGCQSNFGDCSTKCETCKACSNVCDVGYGLQECSGATPVVEATQVTQCGNTCRKCRARTCTEENARCQPGTLNLDYYYSGAALRCFMN